RAPRPVWHSPPPVPMPSPGADRPGDDGPAGADGCAVVSFQRVVDPGGSMEALDLARWQFGITTVYHFIFVPLTIGLSLLVAIMQTIAVRAKDPVRKDAWTRMTKFFGSMLIVNFGIGIATGIVQEFQFGLNWSEYA